MKNLGFKIILITSIMVLNMLYATAKTVTSAELENLVLDKVKEQAVIEVQALGGGEVEVKLLSRPFLDTEIKNNLNVKVESPLNSGFLPRGIKRVTLYDGNNFVKSFPVSVQIFVYKNVLAAVKPIARGDAINAVNTKLTRTDVAAHLGKTLEGYSNTQLIADRNIMKGSAVLVNYVKAKPDVIKDTVVNIIFESKGTLKISLDGKALKEGSVGDTIPVRSEKYNKIYQATITNKNEVTVRI